MIGDGREDGADGKIESDKIRPIWLDDELYTLHVDLDLEAARAELQGTDTSVHFGDNYVTAEAMINTVLYAREKYKGTGTPDFYCTPRMLNVMMLARDLNGRRIYNTKAELASALDVANIYTAEQFANKTRTAGEKTKKLAGIICNLADYSLGATKGGQVTHFTQFDIDFNQEKSLLETRCSGALTRVYSAIAIEEDVTDEVAETLRIVSENESINRLELLPGINCVRFDKTCDILSAKKVNMDSLYVLSSLSPEIDKQLNIKSTYSVDVKDFNLIKKMIIK